MRRSTIASSWTSSTGSCTPCSIAATSRSAARSPLSRSGCRLRLGEDLERGALIRLLLESPPSAAGTSARAEVGGRVIWSRLEGLSYQVGIQFPEVPANLDDVLVALA